MLQLYDKLETKFETNGELLAGAFNAEITHYLNGEYALTFSIKQEDEKARLIENDKIILADGQPFRILTAKPQIKDIDVYAVHVFFDLRDYQVESVNVDAATGLTAMNAIFASANSKFTWFSDITHRSTMNEEKKNIIEMLQIASERFEGELVRNKFVVSLNNQAGVDTERLVYVGKNISATLKEVDTTNVCTRAIIEYGEHDDKKQVVVVSENVSLYSHPKTRRFQNITDDIKTEAQAVEWGLSKFKGINRIDVPKVSVEIDLLVDDSLLDLNCGDTVICKVPELKLDERIKVVGYVYDPLLRRKTKLFIGYKPKGLTGSIGGAVIEQLKPEFGRIDDELQKEIDNMNKYIDGEIEANKKEIEDAIAKAEAEAEIFQKELGDKIQGDFDAMDEEFERIQAEAKVELEKAHEAINKEIADREQDVKDAIEKAEADAEEFGKEINQTIQDTIERVDAEFEAERERVDNSIANVERISGEKIATVEDLAKQHTSQISDMNTDLSKVKDDASKLNSDVTSAKSDITKLFSDTTANKGAITTVTNDLGKLTSTVTEVKTTADNASNKASSVEQSVTGISANVSSLTGTLNTATGDIVNLKKDVTAVDVKADGISTRITSVETVANQANSTASTALSKANTVESTANGTAQTVSTLQTTVNSATGDITKLKSDVTTVTTTATGTATKVTSLESDNVTNKSNISALQTTSTGIQATVTNVTTTANTASTNASTALTNAATAQTAANNANSAASSAQTSANGANSLLTDIASDNKFTPVEKQQAKLEWDIIVSEKVKIDAEADRMGVAKTAFGTAYNSLSTYITPLLSSLTTTQDIVGTTFRTNFKNYYDARQDVLNLISSKAKALADSAQATANTASTNASTALTNAANVDVKANAIQSTVTSNESSSNIIAALASGEMLYKDEQFKLGFNSVYGYASNVTTIERLPKQSDAPTTSLHELKFTVTGNGTQGLGGFVQGIERRDNAVFVSKFIAKLPAGYSFHWNGNWNGVGSSNYEYGNNLGTGKYETYYIIRKVGVNATASSGHVRVVGPTPTASAPLIWYLASATVVDITNAQLQETLTSHQSQITQEANKIAMIVGNGSTASSVVLTPNALTAIAKDITLTGNVQFNSLVEGAGTSTTILGNKIKTGTIAATAIVSSSITATQLAANAVTADKITAGAVTTVKLAAGAVTATVIAAGQITASHINGKQISAAQIVAGTITSAEINATSIRTAILTANAVTATMIAANSITATQIAANAVTTDKLNANSVVAGKIAAGAITATHLSANAITTAALAAGAVTADKITVSAALVNSITAQSVFATGVQAVTLSANRITAGTLQGSGLSWNLSTSLLKFTNATNAMEYTRGSGNSGIRFGDIYSSVLNQTVSSVSLFADRVGAAQTSNIAIDLLAVEQQINIRGDRTSFYDHSTSTNGWHVTTVGSEAWSMSIEPWSAGWNELGRSNKGLYSVNCLNIRRNTELTYSTANLKNNIELIDDTIVVEIFNNTKIKEYYYKEISATESELPALFYKRDMIKVGMIIEDIAPEANSDYLLAENNSYLKSDNVTFINWRMTQIQNEQLSKVNNDLNEMCGVLQQQITFLQTQINELKGA